jgi:hypothetical protein
MKGLQAVILAPLLVMSAAAAAAAGEKAPLPPLSEEHSNPSNTLRFKTPAGWTVTHKPGNLELTEARGDGMILRLLRREGELGLDSLHAECMLVRLAGPMETHPQVDYEYDFVGGEVAGRRALDSAFVVEYDEPIAGEKKWRQRNLTLVGQGESVCVVSYAPSGVWKKSTAARKLLTSMVESVKWP